MITGASADIGCDLIAHAAVYYDKIIGQFFHRNSNLDKLESSLGDKLLLLHANFADAQSSCDFIAALKNTQLSVSHFVHLPALRVRPEKYTKIPWEQFELEMQVSLRSFVQVSQAVLPAMIKRRYGKILVMLSSYTVGVPPKYLSSYITLKYALLGLSKGLACEYADKGITVNGVSPEMIETKFLSNMPALISEKNALSSPRKRNLDLRDITPLLLYLLSDGADAITGQNLAVTGGK